MEVTLIYIYIILSRNYWQGSQESLSYILTNFIKINYIIDQYTWSLSPKNNVQLQGKEKYFETILKILNSCYYLF